MVQKTIIDTFHKEGKSQKVITERSGCSRSAVSKHIKCKVDCKEEVGLGKCAQATGINHRLREYCQARADSNTWESFTRSELKLESVHQEFITLRRLQGKGYQATSETETSVRSILPGLRRKRTGLLLSGPKFSFQMKVNFAFIWKSRSQSLEEE